jgi:hypothetical protein
MTSAREEELAFGFGDKLVILGRTMCLLQGLKTGLESGTSGAYPFLDRAAEIIQTPAHCSHFTSALTREQQEQIEGIKRAAISLGCVCGTGAITTAAHFAGGRRAG